jgi:hypothetical protein
MLPKMSDFVGRDRPKFVPAVDHCDVHIGSPMAAALSLASS